MSKVRLIAAGILALAAVAVVVVMLRGEKRDVRESSNTAEREWQPLSREIAVEVWNGGGSGGAAIDAVRRLRHARLDVVQWGNAPPAMRDTTRYQHRVLVRRGDTTGAGRVIEALGDAEVIDAPDRERLVDLTVIVGRRSPRDSI